MAISGTLVKKESQDRSDLVAYWSVPLSDGVHAIEFEHGTVSGKRVLRVDGKEIVRREWMFKLVGDEAFTIGKQNVRCELRVEPLPHFAYSYVLYVAGKPLNKFTDEQDRVLQSWTVFIGGKRHRIVLEKRTLDVWTNGSRIEAEHSFAEDGTEIRFCLEHEEIVIRATIGHPKRELVHQLFMSDKLIPGDTK